MPTNNPTPEELAGLRMLSEEFDPYLEDMGREDESEELSEDEGEHDDE